MEFLSVGWLWTVVLPFESMNETISWTRPFKWTILIVLLLDIRFPTISYNVRFEKSFITILIKSNLKWPDLMCHHSSNYIPGMNINGDQSTQDVSCKFRKLSTNQGCQFVEVLGKTKYKVSHYSFSLSCRVFAFCSKVIEMSLFLLKIEKRTCR